jgi:hypothetical protein
VPPSREVSNFLLEDYEAVLKFVDFEGRNLGSMQKPANRNKKNTEAISGKEKNFDGKAIQRELFPSRDFK